MRPSRIGRGRTLGGLMALIALAAVALVPLSIHARHRREQEATRALIAALDRAVNDRIDALLANARARGRDDRVIQVGERPR